MLEAPNFLSLSFLLKPSAFGRRSRVSNIPLVVFFINIIRTFDFCNFSTISVFWGFGGAHL